MSFLSMFKKIKYKEGEIAGWLEKETFKRKGKPWVTSHFSIVRNGHQYFGSIKIQGENVTIGCQHFERSVAMNLTSQQAHDMGLPKDFFTAIKNQVRALERILSLDDRK